MFNFNNYKYIIPFGEECYTCESIDSKFNNNKLRNNAFPFDYVGHTFIETLLLKLVNIDTDFKISQSDIELKQFGNNYYYIDTKYQLYYWHDTTHENKEDFTIDELNIFIDKYNRRYDRLNKILRNEKDILIISVNHFDNIYKNIHKKDTIISLYEELHKINKNITVLTFNYDDHNYKMDKLIHVTLQVNKNIPFDESKLLFKKTLFDYFLMK